MAQDHRRLPAIPSYLTGPLVDTLRLWERQLNSEAFISKFSGTTPNSKVSGQPGDLAINVGSASTTTRLWLHAGPNTRSTTSWSPVRVAEI